MEVFYIRLVFADFLGVLKTFRSRETKSTGLGMVGIERQLLSKGAEYFVPPCFICHFIVRTLRTENILVVIPATHRNISFHWRIKSFLFSFSPPPPFRPSFPFFAEGWLNAWEYFLHKHEEPKLESLALIEKPNLAAQACDLSLEDRDGWILKVKWPLVQWETVSQSEEQYRKNSKVLFWPPLAQVHGHTPAYSHAYTGMLFPTYT